MRRAPTARRGAGEASAGKGSPAAPGGEASQESRPTPGANRAGPRPHSDPFPLVASPDLRRWQQEREGGTVPRYIAQRRAAQDHRGRLVEETLRSLNGLAGFRAGEDLCMGTLGTSEKLTPRS